jgi:hypothetical protein
MTSLLQSMLRAAPETPGAECHRAETQTSMQSLRNVNKYNHQLGPQRGACCVSDDDAVGAVYGGTESRLVLVPRICYVKVS